MVCWMPFWNILKRLGGMVTPAGFRGRFAECGIRWWLSLRARRRYRTSDFKGCRDAHGVLSGPAAGG